ncbi:MAG TPA: YceI family protein [Candidatus Kapabacteria bacterium]|nr:YceI family protein [Candidatus Kapabacteria bacterium]
MNTLRNQTRFARLATIPLAVFLMLALVAATRIADDAYSAQAPYRIGGTPTMTLYGTSTLHNWTMTAHSFTANGQFTVSPDNQLTAIGSLSVVLPVQNLKGESGGLNSNAYDALKASTYKDISFTLSSAAITPDGGNKYKIAAHGNLTIAGTTKPITLNATGVLNADQSLSVSGSVAFKMSEYGVKPPTFMFGAMSAGDALTLNYALVFVQ